MGRIVDFCKDIYVKSKNRRIENFYREMGKKS